MNTKIRAALAAAALAASLVVAPTAQAAPKVPQIDLSSCPEGDVCIWQSPLSGMTILPKDGDDNDFVVWYAYNNTSWYATLMTPGSTYGELDGVALLSPFKGKIGPWVHISGWASDDDL